MIKLIKNAKVVGLTLVFLGLTFSAMAEKLDLGSMAELRRFNLQQTRSRAAGMDSVMKAAPSHSIAFVTLEDGRDKSDLEKEGMEVLCCRGNIALVSVDLADAGRLSSLPAVKAMSLQRKVNTTTDLARSNSGVDFIHKGSKEHGLTVPYTGAGVVTAIVDQGFDVHHINFRLPDHSSRIGYLAHLRYNSAHTGIAETHYNETNIADFVTDAATEFHGTHTLGIMAGGYNGPVSVAKPWDDPATPQPAELITENCKYYGVAPGSNIAVSCGDLADGFIAYGMDYMLGYAQYLNRPIVYNLSLGNSSGPHDPRSQMSQFMDEIGKEAIICVSAGNEGDLKIVLKKTFAEGDTTVKTMIHPYVYVFDPANPGSATIRYGAISIYSSDDTPFKLQAVIYNKKRGYRAAMRMPVVGDNVGTYYCSSADYQMDSNDIIGDATFVKAFSGYVGVGGKIDEQTGRYYGMVDFYTINNAITNLSDDYVLGFEIEGKPGQQIECYDDGMTTWLENYGQTGFADGSMDGTISDLAVGHNILVVGSYNTRNEWTCLDGGTNHYPGNGFLPGYVSEFSSFGTLLDGRELPHVCAPGSAIMSSVSWPYAQQVAAEYGDSYLDVMCSAKLVEDDRVNYWKQEVGTSMSTPFVAGAIALWLEANPDLTIDDVKEIVEKTSVRDEQVLSAKERVRWGAGKFDALAGLKEAIRRSSGLNDIEADVRNDRLIFSREGDRIFKAFVGSASRIDFKVYALDGRMVYNNIASGDEMTVDLSSLESGVYVINVNGRHSEKIILN